MDNRVTMSDKIAYRPLIFGEVLFDRFPDGSIVLGGAPFNIAWHLQAFKQSPLFISRVGDDPLGQPTAIYFNFRLDHLNFCRHVFQ